MKTFFIMSTNTDCGKTTVITNIIPKLTSKGKKVFAIKPIISGFNQNDPNSDLHKIASSLVNNPQYKGFDSINYVRLAKPLSPNIAANIEGINLSYELILSFCLSKINYFTNLNYDYLIIESAGGFMSPITESKLVIDLFTDIKIKNPQTKSVLISNNALGTISQTLSAVKCFDFDHILFNAFPNNEELHPKKVLQTINKFSTKKLIPIPKI